jgi:hypothetical protein
MEALYLKSQGLPHNEILRLCHISESTFTNYLWQYIQDGIEGLKKLGYKQVVPILLSSSEKININVIK